jgi:hypothetical protein
MIDMAKGVVRFDLQAAGRNTGWRSRVAAPSPHGQQADTVVVALVNGIISVQRAERARVPARAYRPLMDHDQQRARDVQTNTF